MDLAVAGLRTQPFDTRTPSVWVSYAAQEAAFRFLSDTYRNSQGLGLFHGPPLSGKTSIIRRFMSSLPKDYLVAVVDGAGLRAGALLQAVLTQFGYDFEFLSPGERFNMVKVFAAQQAACDRAPLLIIENTHELKPDALDLLCELTELTDNGTSALRIILVSDQPMLPIMEAEAMQTLAEQVTGRFLLRPLTRPETTAYVHRKLAGAGCAQPERVFPPAVCDTLHATSGGWPGIVDRLSQLALSKAGDCPVAAEHIPPRSQADNAATGITVLPAPVTPHAAPRLILTNRGRTLREITLDKPRLMIGRAEYNDLRVQGEFISRQHVIFVRHRGTTFVLDLKSRNGTFVNGKRVAAQALVNNDIVSIGEHRLKFIDPAARKRTSLRDAGIDETTISKSIASLRAMLAKRTGTQRAG